MGEGRGKLVFRESQPKQSQFPLEGPSGSSFFPSTKSRNTLSGKHPHEPQECSVAEQELQEGVPDWQAGGAGLPAGQAWKGHSKGTDTPVQ